MFGLVDVQGFALEGPAWHIHWPRSKPRLQTASCGREELTSISSMVGPYYEDGQHGSVHIYMYRCTYVGDMAIKVLVDNACSLALYIIFPIAHNTAFGT